MKKMMSAAALSLQLAVPFAHSASGDVTVYGLDQGQQRHSALKQVSTGNVKNLVPVWNLSLASNHTQSQQPLVIDGIMYLPTADATLAVDALTGRQLWKTSLSYPQDVFGVVCCGILNRGLAAHQGKLYRGTLDAHLVALDMQSG
ncbi:PQQ-binding-like beta-propeller repeat protein, partial [Noviherbaspirillum denitrificans]|uniref:PQQ-binding-like beta-propeller repeat protein n=1 Tax=Noviherbaspirillum denitrificans TaxID=1968433 RepID=UPI00148354F4